MGYAVVELTRDLQLRIGSTSHGGTKECRVRLTRLFAQQLADALASYSGGSTKSAHLGTSLMFGAVDLDPVQPSKEDQRTVVRVDKGKAGGPPPVVRLR